MNLNTISLHWCQQTTMCTQSTNYKVQGCSQVVVHLNGLDSRTSHHRPRPYIMNLTSHNLVMEIMQNLFICNLYISHINIVHYKHV
jgi:hypothetical protein